MTTVDDRTVLIGMNNSLSDDDRHALAPYPVNCAGWRVWHMLDDAAATAGHPLCRTSSGDVCDWRVSRQDYLRAFDRRNVLHAREWSCAEARAAGAAAARDGGARRVVVLGGWWCSASPR